MNLIFDPICIVGVGAVSSIGLNAPSTAAAVRAGISGFQEHPFMINKEGEPYVIAMVPTIEPEINGSKRFIDLITPPIIECLKPLQQLLSNHFEIQMILGLPEKRPGVANNLAEELAIAVSSLNIEDYDFKGIRTAYKGHAAGLIALDSASKLLKETDCQFCLVGGADSYIDPDALDWIEDNEQLHIPSNAWGFIPGEAAGFSLLCTTSTAKRYNLPIRATLISIGVAQEENRIKTKTICIGKGLTSAVGNALEALPEGAKINQTYCDQNGEAYRADEFGFMLSRLSKFFYRPSDFIAPADCWGDIGAASAPLLINLLCAAAEKNYGNNGYSLLWASSEDGDRAAAILKTGLTN